MHESRAESPAMLIGLHVTPGRLPYASAVHLSWPVGIISIVMHA